MERSDLPSLEDLLKKLDIKMHFPKLSDHQMKRFLKSLADQMGVSPDNARRGLGSFLFSGSVMEGGFMSRNLKSKQQTSKNMEMEFDIMFPIGEISKEDQESVIYDLPYAKGFVWLRYLENKITMGLKKNLEYCVYEHVDGFTYLNGASFKQDTNLDQKPDLAYFNKFQEEIQGPSNNIDSTFNLKKLINAFKKTTKGNLKLAVATLDKCLGFLQGTIPRLINSNQNIIKELSTCQEKMSKKDFDISTVDVEEFSAKILPRNREKSNPLFQLHWTLIAFVNELLFVLEMTKRIITVNNFEETIGFWKFAFMPLLSSTSMFAEKIIEYIVHLFSLPYLFRQNCDEMTPEEAVEFFLDQCLTKMPDEIERTLHISRRCLVVLGPRYHVLEAICHDHKDDEPINDKYEEMTLNIDRVPAILVHDWPAIAKEYKTRKRKWPSEDIMSTIYESGSHIVPKPFYGVEANENLDWRWSFSQAEMILAYLRTNKMDCVYLIFKTLFYSCFKEVEVDEKSLPSYFAKTVMMWQCEKSSEEWWTRNSVYDCVVVLLEQLKVHFYEGILPHYFIRNLNLFDNISEDLLKYGKAIAESICQDPLPVILEVTFQLLELQSSPNKTAKPKEKSEDPVCPFGRDSKQEPTDISLTIAEFRNTIFQREEKFKDIPEKQGAIKLLKELYYELMPKYWPEHYQQSLTNVTTETGSIQFHLSFNNLEDELKHTNVVKVTFRGSQGLNFELQYSA